MKKKIKTFTTILFLIPTFYSMIASANPASKEEIKGESSKNSTTHTNTEDLFDIEFNNSFNNLHKKFLNRAFGGIVNYANFPALDIYEIEDKYYIKAELPGVSKDQIEVNINNNILSIKVNKSNEEEKIKKDYYLQEIYYGTAQRSFSLPSYVDTTSIDTSFKNGILKIEMKKRKGSESRNIEIKS